MAEHQEDITDRDTTNVIRDKDEENGNSDLQFLKGVQRATEDEHAMTLKEGIQKYPKAVFWSVWFSLALVMEGFDHAFVSGFFAFPAFQKRYGELQSDGSYQISATLQSAVGNGVSAGEIVGLLINGFVADWIGYRWVMISCLFLMTAFIFLQFFATSIYMYLGAEILLGIPWGAFQTLSTTYAAEVCPNVLRPYLTMLVSLLWSVGYLLGNGVLRAFLSSSGEWAYRIPFAIQWAWPLPLVVGIFFAPESPWWLVRKGRTEAARRSLLRLRSKGSPENEVDDTVDMMKHTIKMERESRTSSTYRALFKGTNLRRTEIAVFTYLIQELCAPLVSYIVYFLEQAGLPAAESFDFGMGEYALAIVGVFIAWFLVPKTGRRPLLLIGTAFLTSTTFLIGFLGIPNPKSHPKIGYGIGSILLIQYFVLFITIGPIIYTIVTEIPSSNLRNKSVALARAVYNIATLVYGQLVPHMVQNAAWGWGAKSGFFYGGLMGLGLVWAFFRLPETKNRTFGEVDILFRSKVKARDFKNTRVDITTETVSKEM